MSKKLLLLLISFTLSFILGELLIKYAHFSSEERKLGAEGAFQSHVSTYRPEPKCSFFELTTPHPTLSYISIDTGVKKGCDYQTSNIGLPKTHDFPTKRTDDSFDILILGGSVAEFFATNKDVQDNFLFEKYLNDNYIPPKGKRFRVLNGAMAGWRQPNQLIMATNYTELVESIIMIDGFNELLSYQSHGLMDSPMSNDLYYRLNNTNITQRSRVQKIKKFLERFPFLQSSYSVVFLYHYYIQHVIKSIKDTPRPESLKSLSPENIGNIRRQQEGLNFGRFSKRYHLYLSLIKKVSEIEKTHFLHLLQPIRWYQKELTGKEQLYYRHIDKDSVKRYISLSQSLDRKYSDSLLSLFKNTKQTVYSDHIHFNDYGQNLMIKAIATLFANQLQLKKVHI